MTHSLPILSYDYGALEPYIDAQTMEIHHSKHHQAYVNNLNKALEDHPTLQQKPLQDLLKNLNAIPEEIRVAIRNHGGGHQNHSMFWQVMKKNGGGQAQGKVADAINKQFNNFDAFKDQFTKAAKTQFGSGWAWLCVDKRGDLVVCSTPNQDTPLSIGNLPILCLDVWEHAYYLKYQYRRPEYIDAWWHVVDWEQIESNYEQALTIR